MTRTRFTSVYGLFCLMAISFCCLSVQAQSGRRQAKPAPVAPVPTPTPEPTPKPKPEENQSELRFLVGMDRTTYATYPLFYYDAALRGCAERLRTGSSAQIDVADRDLTRGEAIKKAKAEEATYVVLLRLTSDGMGSSANSGYEDLVLEYVVFAPVTAKVATSGRSYQNANRQGPLIVGPTSRGSSSAIYREQLLKRAGEDAGERILKALNLNVPVIR